MTQPTEQQAREALFAAIEADPYDDDIIDAVNAYRSAVLGEAADAIDATYTGPGTDQYTRYGANLLRRMAEEQP